MKMRGASMVERSNTVLLDNLHRPGDAWSKSHHCQIYFLIWWDQVAFYCTNVSLNENRHVYRLIVVFSVDLVCKEELNLILVYSSQGAVGLSHKALIPFPNNLFYTKSLLQQMTISIDKQIQRLK